MYSMERMYSALPFACFRAFGPARLGATEVVDGWVPVDTLCDNDALGRARLASGARSSSSASDSSRLASGARSSSVKESWLGFGSPHG